MRITRAYKPELLNSVAVFLEREAAIELSYNCLVLGIKTNPGFITHHNLGIYLLEYFPYHRLWGKLFWEDRLFVGLKAEYHLEKALSYCRDRWETWIALGDNQFRGKKYIKALGMYEEAGKYIKDGYSKWKVGNCRWVLNEFDKAEKSFLDAYNSLSTCEDRIEAICAAVICNIKNGKAKEQIESKYGPILKEFSKDLINVLENKDVDIVGSLLWYGCTKLIPILYLIEDFDTLSLLCNIIEKIDNYETYITDDDLEIMKRAHKGICDDLVFKSKLEKQLIMFYPCNHIVRQLYIVDDHYTPDKI